MGKDKMGSLYFHSRMKGCKVEEEPPQSEWGRSRLIYCETHRVELCRCGWEWRHHYEEGMAVDSVPRPDRPTVTPSPIYKETITVSEPPPAEKSTRKMPMKKTKMKHYTSIEVFRLHLDKIKKAIHDKE